MTTTSTSSCPFAPRPRPGPRAALRRAGTEPTVPMPVDHLSIRGFRSYRELEVDFPGGPQVVVGDNAAGKTNLLEAMVVLSLGGSHRTTTDQELITWGEPLARLDATLTRRARTRGRAARGGHVPGARKRVKVNGVPRRHVGAQWRPARPSCSRPRTCSSWWARRRCGATRSTPSWRSTSARPRP